MGKTVLFAVLNLILAGCAPATVPPVAPTSAPRVGAYYFLAANNNDPFYVDGLAGLNAAAKELGVKVQFVGPLDLNLAAQMKTFEELVANPTTAGILWYALDFNAGEPLVKAAVAKGIPVVVGATDAPTKTRSAFVGYDNVSLGQQAAEVAVKAIGGKGKVGVMGLANGSPTVSIRTAAFTDYIRKNYPAVEVVPQGSTDGSTANAVAALDAYMIAHPDLTLLWWADGMAGQMVQPWKEYQAKGVKTLFLGMDMPQPTLQAVKDSVFIASVGQDTYTEEAEALRLMVAARNGKRVPDSVLLKAIIVTKDNVDQFLKVSK